MTKENIIERKKLRGSIIEKIKSLVPKDTQLEINHNDLFVHNGTKYILWEIMNDYNVLWVDYETNTSDGRVYSVLSDFDAEILQHILDAVQANIQEK